MKRCIITLIVGLLCHLASAQSTYRFQYWFDHQFGDRVILSSTDGSWQTPLGIGQLTEGFHTLNLQVQDSNGRWFSPQSYFFCRMPDTLQTYPVYYAYWFDNNIEHQHHDSVSVGTFLLETSGINTGFHTVNFQFRYRDVITLKSYLFYKAPLPPSDTDRIEYAIWFDQDFDHRRSGQFISEHLVLDVDSLPTGFHVLNVLLGNADNATVKSYYFYKRPHEEIQINRYEYWFNDEDSLKRTFAVTPQDTVDVISLIVADTFSIRSTYFHFDPNGGAPIVNAKNDIHFRFYNVNGRYIQKDIPYVDVTVVDTIHADTLERDTTKLIVSPRNNNIHWFKMAAGRGDSLSFHTNRPCTMQLYAPSGKMVFQSLGSISMAWNGCHAWENGDYYLAVHDAEDTGTVAVSYQWIYRYAVLAWDVHRVGNGGLSTITFQGNGFASLDTVYLIKGYDTIPALYIGRENNTETSVFFDFENADTGMYQAVFMYVDENLHKSNVVYVEEARPIVLTTTCSFPSSFVRGSTVTYTYSITNTGNMTAYAVPLYLYIASRHPESISYIKVDGLNLESFYDYIVKGDIASSIPENQLRRLKDFSDNIGDYHYFMLSKSPSENGEDSVSVRNTFFFTTIAPNTTMVVSVKITSTDTVETWLTAPESWNAHSVVEDDSSFFHSSKGFCCWHNGFEATFSALSIVATMQEIVLLFLGPEAWPVAAAAGIVSCVTNMVSTASSTIASFVCNENTPPPTLGQALGRAGLSVLGIATSCYLGETAKLLVNIASGVFGLIDFSSISNRPVASKYDCGGGGGTGGGGVTVPTAAYDPNEITGYIAESGSHSVSAERIQLPYMIEFENDTTFASANAHTVVVRDTLDGRVFDLNSFKATSFSIGENIIPISGGQSFVRTVDMRPAINVIAQVQLDYSINTSFAVATWTFSSLDPMTLLPTTDPTQGFLPANYLGDGIGEVTFTINRKVYLRDSTLINNRAWITFDNEAPIATSTWHNIMDVTPPTSTIDSVMYGAGTVKVSMLADDNLSGVWQYHVYGRLCETWLPLAMNILADSIAFIHVDTSLYTAFRTTAIDSAGNVESLNRVVDTAVYFVPLAVNANSWYAISSPTHNTANSNETVDGVTNLVGDDFAYDLYYYDESNSTWRNYKAHIFDLETGVGYLYRRSAADTLRFTGKPNTGGEDGFEVTLTAGGCDSDLRGFNLIGNPYPYEVSYGSPYYELRPNGTWYAHPSGVIDVSQGFLVHTSTPTTYTFAYPTPAAPDNAKETEKIPLSFTVTGNGYEDVVHVLFDEGEGLPKMGHLSADAPALSIGGKAIAVLSRGTEEFSLTFRAMPGDYALTAHPLQMYYLHLIDKATGAERDLLADSSYTFRHRGHESDAERFLVRLAPTMHETEGEAFAYTDGTNIVVRGEGLLQVFDMLGRLVMTCEVNTERKIPVTHFNTGVYALLLAGKNQKIVVR